LGGTQSRPRSSEGRPFGRRLDDGVDKARLKRVSRLRCGVRLEPDPPIDPSSTARGNCLTSRLDRENEPLIWI
jgi:hypothetical protein